MKNKLIILLLLATTWQAKAQKADYIHLLDTNKVWTEAMILEFGDFNIYDMWIGDTIIYQDTLFYEFFSENYGSPARYLREDTMEKKVWYRQFFDYEEHLYYDFSMEVGDSISFYPLTDYYMKLEQIQNENIFGIERRVYYFTRTWDESLSDVIWIEGIGSLAGLMHPDKAASGFWTWVDPTELNCYYYTDLLQYQSDMASEYGCHFETLRIDEILQNNIKLYPNPAKDYFFINYKKCDFNKKLTLKLYDIFGNCIKQKYINCNKEKIDISNLSSGLYLIKISSDNKILYSNKIIKH